MHRPTLAAAALLCAASFAHGAEPLKLRFGWVNAPASIAAFIFAKPELAPHNGKSYVFEPVHFAGTSPEILALASGDLDAASLAYSSFGAAIENAHMDDLRIVLDGFQDGHEGYYTGAYVVLADSPIRTVEDLKGKVLVSNVIGGAVDMGIRAMLRKHHLEDKKDLSIIEAQFPTMLPMLESRKADLIIAARPFTTAATARGELRTLFTLKDATGPTEMIFEVARRGFLERNRGALDDFFEDWVRALRWWRDPAHHDEAVRIVADHMKMPPASLADWLFTADDYYRDPDGRPDAAVLQQNIDTQLDLGFLKSRVEIARYLDLSFVDEAVRRLK